MDESLKLRRVVVVLVLVRLEARYGLAVVLPLQLSHATSIRKSIEKMYRAGLHSIFSRLLAEEKLHVVDAIDVSEIKTKSLSKINWPVRH